MEHNCRDYEKTKSDIENYGLTVIIVRGTDYLPSFAYSIGLWQKFKHPEVICIGLNTKTLHTIINDVADLVKDGELIVAAVDYENIFDKLRARFLDVNQGNFSGYFGTAIDFYNSFQFPALQLVWPDKHNILPWEEDFEEDLVFCQPLLDRNMKFKFMEAKNLGCFTTRQWLELNSSILRVIHDTNGDWQFLTGDQLQEDARLVALEQLTLRDLRLNEVFDLDYGEEAHREFIGDPWTRRKVVDQE
ncbi:MAG: DUF4262 domain-containing protein [Bacteroidota bacterium]